MSAKTDRTFYDSFFNEHANDLLGKPEEYAARSLDYYAARLAGLFMAYLSLNEGGEIGGEHVCLFADGAEPWEVLLARHADAELGKAAALFSVAFGIWIGDTEETTTPQAAAMWSEVAGGSPLTWAAAELAYEMWALSHHAAFTERDSWGDDHPAPRRERLPHFWAAPPFLLTQIEAAHDVYQSSMVDPGSQHPRPRREGLRGA